MVCDSTTCYCFLLSYTLTSIGGMGDIEKIYVDESMINVLIDIAFILHHQFDSEVPFELQPFKDELEVLLNTLNFTIH